MFPQSSRGSVPLVLLLVALLAVSCTAPTAAPPAAAPPQGPTGTLNVGLKLLGSFSCHPRLTGTPQAPTLAVAGFETLVTTDAKGAYKPMLAERWEISPDLTTWTFHLRRGVQFHKGYGEMTADDVIYSLNQAAAEGSVNGNAGNYRRLFNAKDGSIKAIDKYTVAINTGTPQFDMLNWVRSPISGMTWIISKKQVDELGEKAAGANCAGTGPWEFVEAKDGQYWRFKAVNNHWLQTPAFEELYLWEIPEEATRVANFQAGKLDTLVSDLDSLPALQQVNGARVMVPGGGAEMHLGMYGNYYTVARPAYDATLPWVSKSADPNSADWDKARKVRQAMAFAIDRESIVKTLLQGRGEPAVGWAWGPHPDRLDRDQKWEFNPSRAKQLLAEAGYPNGFEVTLTPRLTGVAAEVQACEAIATMWQNNLGLRVRFQNPPNDAIRASLVARSYKGITCQAVGNVPEPINQYTNWAVTSGGFSGGVEHPIVDDLVLKATKEFDTEKRWALQKQIGRFMFDNALDIGVYNVHVALAIGPRIEDWSKDWLRGDARIINALAFVRHRR